jgi:hypothetical protein
VEAAQVLPLQEQAAALVLVAAQAVLPASTAVSVQQVKVMQAATA